MSLQISLAPVSAQNCKKDQFNKDLEGEAPTQLVGEAHSDLDLSLNWSPPADFTEIFHFVGKPYQLAEHEGIDFIHSDPLVTIVLVRAVEKGKVVYIRSGCPQSNLFEPNTEKRECGGDWGNHIIILHPNGLFTRYAHLHPDSIQVQVGQIIRRGEVIAKMGNSGRSDIRHLHFELGVTIKINPCGPPQSFRYVYNSAIYFGWPNLKP